MSGDEAARDLNEPRRIDPESIEVLDYRQPAPTVHLPPPRYEFRRRKRLALVLFIVTCISTFLVGSNLIEVIWHPSLIPELIKLPEFSRMLVDGAIYSVSLMAILLAHEMGHFLQARRNHVPATMPFFIPMPLPPFGTMGAVIVQGAGFANRKALFDIAITGPLAGLVLALPISLIGIQLSTVGPIPPNPFVMRFGEPLLFQWGVHYVHGTIPPGYDMILHPLAFAGWVGIFITALNLVPIGQLDGGHMLYTLIGRRAHTVAVGLLWGALLYMLLSRYPAYLMMIFLLLVMGPKHPPTADDSVPLGRGRIILGWLTLSFIVVGFTPTPILL